jgi:hypothetical protein
VAPLTLRAMMQQNPAKSNGPTKGHVEVDMQKLPGELQRSFISTMFSDDDNHRLGTLLQRLGMTVLKYCLL